MGTSLSTAGVAVRLRRLGLVASEASLRADIHRGLVHPAMPSGRGRTGPAARWTPAAVRRAEYLARLRRRGVNGQVLPLLAFVYDGWGWEGIRSQVQRAAQASWAIDRRGLNRSGRVRDMNDLMLNVDTGAPEGTSIDWSSTLLPARQALTTGAWFGAPAPGVSFLPFVLALRRQLPGPGPSSTESESISAGVRALESRRRSRPLAAGEVPDWLESLSVRDVRRGREALAGLMAGLRALFRLGGSKTPNPLLMANPSAGELAAELRRQPGRPSATTMLGSAIAQAMVVASYLSDEELREQGRSWSPVAPPFAGRPPAANDAAR